MDIVADTQEILARAEHRDAELVLDGAEVRKMNDRLFEEASKDPTNMQHLEDMADPEKNFFRKDRGAGWWSCNASRYHQLFSLKETTWYDPAHSTCTLDLCS